MSSMIVVLNDAMTIFLTFFAASKWMHKVNTCFDINRTTFWSRTIYFVNASVNVSAERVHLKAHPTTRDHLETTMYLYLSRECIATTFQCQGENEFTHYSVIYSQSEFIISGIVQLNTTFFVFT